MNGWIHSWEPNPHEPVNLLKASTANTINTWLWRLSSQHTNSGGQHSNHRRVEIWNARVGSHQRWLEARLRLHCRKGKAGPSPVSVLEAGFNSCCRDELLWALFSFSWSGMWNLPYESILKIIKCMQNTFVEWIMDVFCKLLVLVLKRVKREVLTAEQ